MSMDPKSLRSRYNAEYFSRYDVKTTLGTTAGERRFFYDYWNGYLRNRIRAGGNILEIGCGGGYFLDALSRHFRVYAVDVSPHAVARARARAPRVLFGLADAQRLPFANGCVDCVLAFDVIEHLPTPEALLGEARRVLKPGGLLIFSTPNPKSLGARVKARMPSDGHRNWEQEMSIWHGWRDETHVNIRRSDEWRQAIHASGMKLIRDGTDFWWDTPYFRPLPILIEKAMFNGGNRVLTRLFGFLPWGLGENYHAVARKDPTGE